MLKENPIIVYTADCRGSLENCVYQNRIEITDTHAAAEAFRFDSVFAQYKNDYRSKENFLGSNALPMDCDNDHSDEPTDWITPEDIGFFFAGVPHILHFSRHHMKRKGDNSPRPRFHVIFLIDPTTSEQEYAKLKEQIMGVYPYFPYGQFLGYRKGADGLPEIVAEEAENVRKIYRLFMQGESTNAIAGRLTAEGIPTPGGKTQWRRATVDSILSNEKYKGSALLQKSFTVDFLTKKTKANEGEVPQYYVQESHPAIIEPDEWQEVQTELAKRKRSHKRHRQTSVFSGKIFCGDCGEIYGSKVWHSTSKYRRVIWQCNAKFSGERKCGTPHLYEEQLQRLFVAAMSEYMSDRESAISDLQYAQRSLTDTDFIDEDIRGLEQELELNSDMIWVCINSNASNAITEEEYHAKHGELCSRFEQTEEKLNGLRQQRERMQSDAIAIGGMLFELTELDALPITFNEKLWNAAIDRVTVYADERVLFHFKDGKDITELL